MAGWGLELGNLLPLAIYLDGLKGCMLWSKGMYREPVRRMIGHLKRALRMEHRLTVEEFYKLLQLSEAIIDYGRMIQTYCGYSVPYVIVEVPELARRFRETPRTIKDALRLLSDMGQAESAQLHGCWKLQLASTLLSGREGARSATHPSQSLGDHNRDLGAA
jgi:hypothetical protein